jgi:hypothetical protein
MQEITRSNRTIERPGPGGLGSIFGGGNGGGSQLATVEHGTHVEQLPVANMTVGEIRRRFADRFHIAPTTQATLDARNVDDQTVVRAGQSLKFMRHAGEKGR